MLPKRVQRPFAPFTRRERRKRTACSTASSSSSGCRTWRTGNLFEKIEIHSKNGGTSLARENRKQSRTANRESMTIIECVSKIFDERRRSMDIVNTRMDDVSGGGHFVMRRGVDGGRGDVRHFDRRRCVDDGFGHLDHRMSSRSCTIEKKTLASASLTSNNVKERPGLLLQ